MLRGQPHNGRHGARIFLSRLVHERPPDLDQLQGILQRDDPGGVQGGIFTQTVAGHGGRPISQVFQHGQRGQVDRGHRRLQISGQRQFLQRSLEAQLPKGQVEQRFSPIKHLAGRGVLIVDFPAHAYILGTLPWK